MENGTVVPDVYRWGRPLGGDIGFNPKRLVGCIPEPGSSSLKRSARDVQDTHASDTGCEQVVRQAGVPPPTSPLQRPRGLPSMPIDAVNRVRLLPSRSMTNSSVSSPVLGREDMK